jgi:hypothetical protein
MVSQGGGPAIPLCYLKKRNSGTPQLVSFLADQGPFLVIKVLTLTYNKKMALSRTNHFELVSKLKSGILIINQFYFIF